MQANEKPRIKLSELTDMYDIEDDSKDTKNIPEVDETKAGEWETTIEQGDKQLEDDL